MRQRDLVAGMRGVLVALCLSSYGAAALGGPAPLAEGRIASMLGQLDALSERGDLSDSAIAAGFARIAARHFDREAMVRTALASLAGRLTRDEWAGFVSAYEDYLEYRFVRSVRRSGAASSRVLGSRVTSAGVETVVTRTVSGDEAHDAVWFMCRADPGRVCDIEIDGVLVSTQQRDDFSEWITARRLDRLIAVLRRARPGGGD